MKRRHIGLPILIVVIILTSYLIFEGHRFYINRKVLDAKKVTISTNKLIYDKGEKINITINSSKIIYTDFPKIKIKIYQHKKWNYINISCQNYDDCIGKNLFIESDTSIAPLFARSFNGQESILWNQEECIYKKELCGTHEFKKGTKEKINLSKNTQFKAEFCYWEREEAILSQKNITGNPEKKICVETKFTINL